METMKHIPISSSLFLLPPFLSVDARARRQSRPRGGSFESGGGCGGAVVGCWWWGLLTSNGGLLPAGMVDIAEYVILNFRGFLPV